MANKRKRIRHLSRELIAQFWASVDQREATEDDPDPCWLWRGQTFADLGIPSTGLYGCAFGLGAHVIAWFLDNDQKQQRVPGQVVMHDCDNPLCCKPSHLRLGTNKDNTQDMLAKGRHQ